MTDYNDGKWHGWNGGACPVHPRSVVTVQHEVGSFGFAGDYDWEVDADCCDGRCAIVAFRVTKPYREPETYTGECFAYHYTSSPPALAVNQVNTSIPGKYTATHINGKLSKIVWEASE